MASYLRPRRGKKSTAESQNIILKRGEVFFESPETGVGTGAGKIKIGDGTTIYSNLPYFLESSSIDVANAAITFTEATSTTPSTLLSALTSGAKLNTLIGTIKKLLNLYNTSISNLQTSFQNGCSTIANAITANGVTTASNAAPATMANNINTVATNKYNAGVTATKVGTAVASNVLAGKTFTNSSGVGLSGSMVDRGAWTDTPTGSGRITVPAGYHNGTGYVDTATVYNNAYNAGVTAGAATGRKVVNVNNVPKTLQSGYRMSCANPGGSSSVDVSANSMLYKINLSDVTGGWVPYLVIINMETSDGKNKFQTIIKKGDKVSFLCPLLISGVEYNNYFYSLTSFITTVEQQNNNVVYAVEFIRQSDILVPVPRPSDGFIFNIEAWS
jgi:hypothetical protein